MAEIKPTANINLDLTRPVDELNQVIGYVVGAHPGREIEILEAVGKSIHEAVKKMEKQKYEQAKKEAAEPREA